jgi:hypothetical protein
MKIRLNVAGGKGTEIRDRTTCATIVQISALAITDVTSPLMRRCLIRSAGSLGPVFVMKSAASTSSFTDDSLVSNRLVDDTFILRIGGNGEIVNTNLATCINTPDHQPFGHALVGVNYYRLIGEIGVRARICN